MVALSPRLLMLAGVALTALVYSPGLSGPFLLDDHWNLLQNSALQIDGLSAHNLWQAALSGNAGPLGRPIPMASFAIEFALTGFEPFVHKTVNLLIHLLNGVLLYQLSTLLIQHSFRDTNNRWNARTLGALAAIIWLIHPLNLSSVLYVVQRMTLLSTFFCLAGLLIYVRAALSEKSTARDKYASVLAVAVFTPLSAFCKETGALLPLLMLTLELTLFRRRERWLYLLFLVSVGLPALATILMLLIQPALLTESYLGRDFTPFERLLTESRIIWIYLGLIALPSSQRMGLFHDDIGLSTSLLQPLSTLPALLGIAIVLYLAFYLRTRLPLVSFAILFFFAGHSLESTLFGLELTYEHRNYLPQIGIWIAVCGTVLPRMGHTKKVFAAGLVIITIFAATSLQRAVNWSSLERFSLHQLNAHPESPRSQYQMGRLYAQAVAGMENEQSQEVFFRAIQHFARATELSPGFKDGLFGMVVLYSTRGLPIPEGVIDQLAQRLREQAINNNDRNQWQNLMSCLQAGACTMQMEQLEQLKRAIE